MNVLSSPWSEESRYACKTSKVVSKTAVVLRYFTVLNANRWIQNHLRNYILRATCASEIPCPVPIPSKSHCSGHGKCITAEHKSQVDKMAFSTLVYRLHQRHQINKMRLGLVFEFLPSRYSSEQRLMSLWFQLYQNQYPAPCCVASATLFAL